MTIIQQFALSLCSEVHIVNCCEEHFRKSKQTFIYQLTDFYFYGHNWKYTFFPNLHFQTLSCNNTCEEKKGRVVMCTCLSDHFEHFQTKMWLLLCFVKSHLCQLSSSLVQMMVAPFSQPVIIWLLFGN